MPTDSPDASPQQSRFSRLHGLIIGIDKYKAHNRQDPQGCVADAMSLFHCFTGLGVPSENLLRLFDEQATREAILNAFETHLLGNSRIRPQDPIVIYFAGLGDCMPAPANWNIPNGTLEMIVPHDAGYQEWIDTIPSVRSAGALERQSSALDAPRKYIHCIPDITLASLLHRLSQAKGNNITVILDCSHSGYIPRGEVQVRSSYDSETPRAPDTLDVQLRYSLPSVPSSKIKFGSRKQSWTNLKALDPDSHILLAACLDDEHAQELSNVDPESGELSFGGVFTTALLKELRSCDIENTSYAGFIRSLVAVGHDSELFQHVGPQTFQCEGRNQDRPLFSTIHHMHKMPEQIDSATAPTALVAGSLDTIASRPHSTEPNTLPENACATAVKGNDRSKIIRVWVDELLKRTEPWQKVLDNLDLRFISWATSSEHCDLALLLANEDLELRAYLILGKLTTSHILKRSLDPSQLAIIIDAVIYFHADLKDHNPKSPFCARPSMALHELKVANNPREAPMFGATGDDLLGDSISVGTFTSIQSDPDKAYGLRLTNKSTEDLYPYILYYDSEDCSIGILYEPSQKASPPLRAGQSLTIGYENWSTSPFQIEFTSPGSDKEYGALVLMVFNEWVPIHYLKLDSPFESGWSRDRWHRYIEKPRIWDIVVARLEIFKD